MIYIALLRGINVGGKHKLPMSDLKVLLERTGCVDVRTYIQSGNVILSSAVKDPAVLEKQITAAISKRHGFAPRVLLLTCAELQKAAAANPFPQADKTRRACTSFSRRVAKEARSRFTRSAEDREREFCAERQGLLSPHARRLRHIEAGPARRKVPRRRGRHGPQLAHGHHAVADGEGGREFHSITMTSYP